MKYLVFAVTRKKGINFLENLIGEMKYKEIKSIRKSNLDMIVELYDGTLYQVVSASDNSRGHKCNKAYVDTFINSEIMDCVIKPCLLWSDLPEEEQIIYFN